MMKIIAVGDIMPGGILNKTNREYVVNEVKDILKTGDIRIGTLETAIGNEPTFYVEKMKRLGDVIYAEDDDLKRLVELDINIVSLANNHFFDLGPDGARHTISLLDNLGIKHVGAGNNIYEASKPIVITKDNKTYAFLAFCDWRKETTGWCPFATETNPGINPMHDDYVYSEIKKYRVLYDYIIVIPHWGVEYDYKPSINVYRTRNIMLKAGADLILGGHTHCIQPIINKNGKSTVFSLGNFLFPDRLICKPRSTYYSKDIIDLNSLPTTEGYPYVEEITYKKWKPIGRVGMIAIANISKNLVFVESKYVRLTEGNVLELVSLPNDIGKKIKKLEKIISTSFYEYFLLVIRLKQIFIKLCKKILIRFRI